MRRETHDPLNQVSRPDAVRIAVEQTENRLRRLRVLLLASEAVENAGLRESECETAEASGTTRDDLLNIALEAHRAGKTDLEHAAFRQLKERFGLDLSFGLKPLRAECEVGRE